MPQPCWSCRPCPRLFCCLSQTNRWCMLRGLQPAGSSVSGSCRGGVRWVDDPEGGALRRRRRRRTALIDHGLLSGLPKRRPGSAGQPAAHRPEAARAGCRWEGLPPAQARMADALRLFVVTWDPLEWLAPRPEAVATANPRPLELVVYVSAWSLADIARRKRMTMAAVLARAGAPAVPPAAPPHN